MLLPLSIIHRRYMGHKRTIRPNAKRLSALFMARDQMDWDTFAKKVKSCQRGFMGEPEDMKLGRGEFHEFPYACICEKPSSSIENKDHHTQVVKDSTRKTRNPYNVYSREKALHVSMKRNTGKSERDHENDEVFPD